jgi:hypothetical protein
VSAADHPTHPRRRPPRADPSAPPSLASAVGVSRGGFGATRARGLRCRWVIARGSPAPARPHRHRRFDPRQRPRHRGKAAIDHQPQRGPRQPAAHWLPHLPAPGHTGLMPSWAARRCRPAEGCQQGPRPHPLAPGHRPQAPHRHPRQAQAADHLLRGGAHRIAIAALGRDRAPAAAFHGVVRPEADRGAWGDQARDEHSHQHPPPWAGGPGRPVQDPVIMGAVARPGQTHCPPGGGDGARPGGADRAQEPPLGVALDPARNQWGKRGQDQDDGFWQGWHERSSVASMNFDRVHLSSGTPHPPAYSKWPKSSKTGQETKGARGRTGGVDKRASHQANKRLGYGRIRGRKSLR